MKSHLHTGAFARCTVLNRALFTAATFALVAYSVATELESFRHTVVQLIKIDGHLMYCVARSTFALLLPTAATKMSCKDVEKQFKSAPP
jgi:hypothetical protein